MPKNISPLRCLAVASGLAIGSFCHPSLISAAPASSPIRAVTLPHWPGATDWNSLTPAMQAKVSPALRAKMLNPDAKTDAAPGLVIITFNTATGLPGVVGLQALLTRLGIVPVARLETLGMITAVVTNAQIAALAADPSVRSVWNNYRLYYNLHQARVLCGVDKLRADVTMTALNGGKVVDGSGGGPVAGDAAQPNKPQFSVVVIDSGIDTTGVPVNPLADPTNPSTPLVAPADLSYDSTSRGVLNATGDAYLVAPTIPNTKVIQNVQVVGDSATGTLRYEEYQSNNDSVGHGTHCSGIVGGTGAFSKTLGEDFSGVASGVKIIGCGSGAGLFVLDALGGFNYALSFQTFYNVRITSNSYGSEGPYDPADPLNAAIKTAYDRNITTVFAAGNSGPGVDTTSNNSKSPYVINVAAGTKEGGLASFSSRGKPLAERAVGSVDEYNLPAITAPGTGREFESDGPFDPNGTSPYLNGVSAANPNTQNKGFYSDMISTRSKTGSAASGTNDQEFPASYIPNYTMISGTSMACPFVAGACALLLDVDPTLTPDSKHPAANGRKGLKEILQATATHMPDYQDYEVGAGYLNVFAAVDLAFNPSKPYAPFNRIDTPYKAAYAPFITQISSGPLSSPGRPTGYPPAAVTVGSPTARDEDFTLTYSPSSTAAADYNAAKTKATMTNANAYALLVDADVNGNPVAGLDPSQKTAVLDVRIQFGNDPAGLGVGNTLGVLLWAPDGTSYSSGIALPVESAPNRQVVVKNPVPGLWVAELRGLRGLAAVPVTPPTGVGVPDTVTGQIYRASSALLNPPTDADNIRQSAAIQFCLVNRYMDQPVSGQFQPTANVTRAAFAQVLADNVPLRQTLNSVASAFSDVSGNLARQAEAAAQNGSTLRDWDFTPKPTLPSASATFTPNSFVSRMQAATALVRALGLEKEALHLTGTAVKVTYQGGLIPVADAELLAPNQLGYLQLALNRGLIGFTVRVNSTGGIEAVANPIKNLIRADLATAIVNFRDAFRVGNVLETTELQPQNP